MLSMTLQIVTATVETVGELDLAPNIPQEHVVKAVARAVTLTEEDVGRWFPCVCVGAFLHLY